MPRCGCTGTCSCLIVAGEGVIVEGIGTVENPYAISSDAAELVTRVEFTDTSTIDFTTSGLGSGSSPLVVSAVAKVAMGELTDVQGAPTNNQVLVWSDDHWEPQDQSGSGGTTLPPGGTDGQVLTKQSDLDGDADWETFSGGGGGGVLTPAEPYYAASRNHAAATSFTTATTGHIPFDTEVYTEGIPFDGTAFVIPATGYYTVLANVTFAPNATGGRSVYINVNGVAVASAGTDATSAGTRIGRTIKLNQGDLVQIRAQQTSGGNLALAGGVGYNWVSIVKTPSPGGVPTAEQVYASARSRVAAQSIPNGSWTAVLFDTDRYSDGIAWSTDSFVIPVDGYYHVSGGAHFVVNTTGYRNSAIYVNGVQSTLFDEGAVTTVGTSVGVALTIKCKAGDLVSFRVWQNSGAALDLVASGVNNWLTVTKVPSTIPANNGIVGERIYAASRASNSSFSVPTGASHTIIPFEVDERNDGIGWDATANAYTIPVTGWYKVTGAVQYGSHAAGYRLLAIYLNGGQVGTVTDIPAAANGGQSLVATKDLYLTAGDKVSLRTAQTSGAALTLSTTSYNFFSITKIPSVFPQSVAIGERTYASSRAHGTATSLPNATSTVIPYDSAVFEDGITWDGTGFVIPVDGYYDVEAIVTFAASNTVGVRSALLMLNSTQMQSSASAPIASQVSTTVVSGTIKCSAGSVISIRAYQSSGGAATLYADLRYNRVSIHKVPAPAVAGSAASGVWGTAPLDLYGSNDLVGKAVYVDSRGQLRAQPTAVVSNTKPATDPPSSYPLGWSSMDLDNTFSIANGWTQSSMVETVRRNAVGNTTAVQWQYYTNSNIVRFRSSAAGDTWGPWVDVIGVGSNKKMASGRVQITVTNSISGSTAVTFPAGLFTAAPRVSAISVGSTVWLVTSSNAPTTTGFTVAARHVDNTVSTGTVNIDWIAVEDG